jgi:hypothetical protein
MSQVFGQNPIALRWFVYAFGVEAAVVGREQNIQQLLLEVEQAEVVELGTLILS